MINVNRFDQATRVELYENDQLISWLTINHLKIYVWGKEFTAGGIGGVGTKPEFRKKGYSRAVLDKTVEVLKEDKYDFSLLFGIPNYYYRWGFTSCLPQNSVEIATYQAERAQQTHKISPLLPAHFPSLVSIYNKNNISRTGAVVRNPEHFTTLRLGSTFGIKAEGYVLEKNGQIEGYIILDEAKRRVNACEIGGLNTGVYHSCLAFLAEQAISKRLGSVSATLPQDHPFVLLAREYGATVTANYVYNADGMGRIVSQDNVLKTLEDQLYKNSGLDSEHVALLFKSELGATKLGKGPKSIQIAVDQKTLTQLIFGYRDASSLKFEGKIQTDLTEEILQKMFPLRLSHLSGPDKF